MTAGWTVFVAVLGSIATILTAFQGFRIVTRGKRTTFTANVWRRLTELEVQLKQERAEREREGTQFRAALQQFRQRDGTWLELWHNTNVRLTTAGLPAVQLPEKLRKWPEEINAVT